MKKVNIKIKLPREVYDHLNVVVEWERDENGIKTSIEQIILRALNESLQTARAVSNGLNIHYADADVWYGPISGPVRDKRTIN